MDIAAMSTVLSQMKVQQQASISVMKMAMDTAKGNGEALTQLVNENAEIMAQSVQLHLGANVDVNV